MLNVLNVFEVDANKSKITLKEDRIRIIKFTQRQNKVIIIIILRAHRKQANRCSSMHSQTNLKGECEKTKIFVSFRDRFKSLNKMRFVSRMTNLFNINERHFHN